MGVLEGCLKEKAKVFDESSTGEVARRHHYCDAFALQLHERIVQHGEKELTAPVFRRGESGDVALNIDAIEIFVDDADLEEALLVYKAEGRSPLRRPLATGKGANPRADDVFIASDEILHSTPPGSRSKSKDASRTMAFFVFVCKPTAMANPGAA